MTQSTTTVAPEATLDPELKRIAGAVITGAVAVILDTTIVGVALHELGAALDASVETVQWVSTAYLLAMFVSIPVSGWAQNRLGAKRLWLLALTVFLAGSVLCACAWSVESLIAFRVVQGLGGGVMMPLMTTILMQAAHGRNLGRLMAAVSLPAALGPILGPVVGGLILGGLSWQWLFLVNVPFCAVGLALAVRLLPADGPGRRVRLDLPGLLLVSPGVVAVIYGLSNVGGNGGFGRADVLVPLAVGLVLLAAFAVWGLRRGSRALIDVRLLRHRPLTVSAVLLFLTGAALYGAMLLLPLYWQTVRGQDALGAGLLLIPQGVGALASRALAGRLTDSIGGRWVAVVGFAVLAVATLPFAYADSTTPTWWLLLALLARGLGFGAVVIPLMTLAYQGLARDEMPDASIVTRVAMQIGGSFGTALLAVVVAGAGGFDRAFWWSIGLTVAAAGLSFLVPARPPTPAPARPS
ncbi:MDR family MFS transporter [Nocardioides sp. YIM 152315]|uniref:MDR family MFS transporter n=1 Tax=Nocardioides sp. YIM 152315 TaxID=3031760 RepID=UPI0023DBD71F|nr:MDR family MFS transporter [Nocardioides sp. YIM 152315]MDF1602638.1 MDR family MFS transporter [Nocardioides sp. YIM 152315]